jgi:hypothetical protein
MTGCVTRSLYLATRRIMFRVMIEQNDIETPTQRRARQKREAAERARAYRKRKRIGRMPLPRDVDAAWTEATAFWLMRHAPRLRADGVSAATMTMPIYRVMTIARAILERQGFSRRGAAIAITDRLSPRRRHEDPDFVPALEPRIENAPVRQPKMGTGWDDWDALLDDMIQA